jgi:hypothetical protein
MPITPNPPFPKNQGDIIRSGDWNQMVNETIRLDNDKLNRAGDAITGSLTIGGSLGIATTTSTFPLGFPNSLGDKISLWGQSGTHYGFGIQNALLQIHTDLSASDIAFGFGSSAAFTETFRIKGDSSVQLHGDLLIPNTGSGNARLSHATFVNENTLQPNNVKLIMGNTGFIIGGSFSYEFAIGHTFTSIILEGGIITSFVKRLSVTQDGNLFVAGSATFGGGKGGYVVENFVNRVDDTVELGDVVVIAEQQGAYYHGVANNIPVIEVDLSTTAYDRRVCGIVEKIVTAGELPFVEPPTPAVPPEGGAPRETVAPAAEALPEPHPLQHLAAPADATATTQVGPDQMGKMVTMGAFAHCKVDADIAPIAVGDLLTTSPTKGHAQKALEPEKAIGAILGKALGALESGKGKIPVLVMLQ